ncbi:dihydrofolate reductase family protein [Acidovorax sp.]|uniref:dihydrofolate reductase family protein n=1 Tax=Acidovorax sp. TaxID=1872122 RepID=UPI003D048DCE
MTEVTYYVAATLDDFIAGPSGELDWLHPFEQAGTDYGLADFMAGVDALVMGRTTYAVAHSFGDWPYGERPAWVLSHQDAPTDGSLPPSVFWGAAQPHELVAQWMDRDFRQVWLVGGGQLAGQFLRAGLVDHLMLATIPVTLGSGLPLWGVPQKMAPQHWTLQAHQAYPNGVLTQHFKRVRSAPSCG